jgi:hypothetical protein
MADIRTRIRITLIDSVGVVAMVTFQIRMGDGCRHLCLLCLLHLHHKTTIPQSRLNLNRNPNPWFYHNLPLPRLSLVLHHNIRFRTRIIVRVKDHQNSCLPLPLLNSGLHLKGLRGQAGVVNSLTRIQSLGCEERRKDNYFSSFWVTSLFSML